MCFFHYNQCDGCRFPDTNTITISAVECDEFQAGYVDGRIPPHNLDQATDPCSSTWEERWESVRLGLYTVARKRDGVWVIKPERACVRWTPAPMQWFCDACLNRWDRWANDITAPLDNLEQTAVVELPASSGSIPDSTASTESSKTLVELPEQTSPASTSATEADSNAPAGAWEQVASGSIILCPSASVRGQFDWEMFENGSLPPDDEVRMLDEEH